MARRHGAFQMPTVTKITGRSSSITNAFVSAIIPVIHPTHEEVEEALSILGMAADDIRCVYCGDRSTEWDHLRPLVSDRKPTGYISEIANLVPACGKCNQSKGKRNWREWMLSTARRSPAARGVEGLPERVAVLERYEQWRQPVRIDFDAVVGGELWGEHMKNWSAVLAAMTTSQKHADRLRERIATFVRAGVSNSVTPTPTGEL